MPSRKSAVILVATIALSAPLLLPLQAQQRDRVLKGNAAQLAAVLEKMRATCQQLVQLRTEEYRAGKTGFRQLLSAQQELLEIELQLEKTPDERKKLLSQHLELAKATDKLVETQYRAGRAQQGDLLECQLLRMNIDMSILKEPN